MLQLYQNNDCVELIEQELEINPNFLEFSNEGKENYFLKIDQNAEFLKHYCDENLAGFIACYCNNYESRRAFISLVLIDKLYRGKGISKKIFSQLFTLLKEKDFKSCSLEVRRDNVNALNLYKSLGFKSVESTDPHSITMNILL
ncbi:GNAT family N-acetyltransferase [Acinetobacter sp. YH12070]|uniref:GNAT family N-acetyltransferase n=1 Tax=Acinetobacter sp. YH12070 TaxID=2601066 RepID=UPI0015D25B29